MEIHPRVSAIEIPGFIGICLYLVRGQKTAIIDTGPNYPLAEPVAKLNIGSTDPDPGQEATTISAALNHSSDNPTTPVVKYATPVLHRLGMTLADIDFILNSHVHFDHTAGNAAVKRASNAQILIHADEAIYFEKPELLFERELAPIIELILGKEHLDEEKRRYMNEETGPGPYVAVDRHLEDNDIIELGGGLDLKVIHLPGHTPGSVGFYWEEEGILFAGDSLEGICGFGGGLPILDDLAAYESSLARVQELAPKVLVHAHPFQSLTIFDKNVMRDVEIKQYLEECGEFAQRLREAAKTVAPDFTKRPFFELYDEVIGMLPKEACLKTTSEMPRQFFSAATLLNCIKKM